MPGSNDRLITDAAQFLEAVSGVIAQANAARRQRDALTGSASVERGRITVVVNASGSIIETVFADDIGDLTYGRIARATLQAAQQAAAEVKRKTDELLAPIVTARAAMPQLSDLIEGMPPLPEKYAAPPPAVPLTSPEDRQSDSAAIEFEESVEYRPASRSTFDR